MAHSAAVVEVMGKNNGGIVEKLFVVMPERVDKLLTCLRSALTIPSLVGAPLT